MSTISIYPKIEGIYSRKSFHNGDEKVVHIYLPLIEPWLDTCSDVVTTEHHSTYLNIFIYDKT